MWLAIRAFFATMFHRDIATRIRQILDDRSEPDKPVSPSASNKVSAPGRNDAITLLATLQREARFVDIVNEPLAGYSDAQIGAAARDVLKDCNTVLQRLFALKPVVDEAEGSELETPAGYDAGRFHVTGKVEGTPPFRGQMVHHGWEATRCQMPQWTGRSDSALVIAPVELEVK